jgi:hypothetical protein
MTDSDLIAARLNATRLGYGERIEYFRGHLAMTCQDGVTDKSLHPDAPAARKVRRAAQEAEAAGRVQLTQRRVSEAGCFAYLATGTGQ